MTAAHGPDVIGPWIDGARATAGADMTPVLDPATGETLAQLATDGAGTVDAAVTAARRSFGDGRWSRLPVAARQTVLRRVAATLRERSDEFAALESRDTGIPLYQCRQRHLPRAVLNFEFFADYIGQAGDEAWHQRDGFMTVVKRDPAGVAALLSPWNAPLALATMKLAGALAFGNSCILKPSELAPLAFLPLMEVLKAAGVPDGVVNLVNGPGPVTGAALVAHPGVDVVAFTGGTATGRAVGAAAGAGLKKIVTELGGKSANIVLADADLDQALEAALVAGYSGNGQQCLAGSRLLVQRAVADAFLERLARRVKALPVGPPSDPATAVGPLISAPQRDRVLHYARQATLEGGRILAGGGVPKGFTRGFYVEPTLALAPHNDVAICQEEIFGPFVTALTFDTLDEALALANGTAFGLVAYVWTKDLAAALQAADGLRSGVVWINTTMQRELRAPFGGYGASGVGRAGGAASRDLFTEAKTVMLPVLPAPIPPLTPR